MNTINDKQTKLHSSLFFSFTMTIVVTIIALSAILYFQFERIALHQSFAYTMSNLAQTSREASLMTVTAGTFAKQIYYDKHIRKLLNFSEVEIVDTTNALTQLNSYRATSPFIDSIYVYNAKKRTFYISSDVSDYAVQSEAEIYDKQIVDIVRHAREYPTLAPIPRRMPVESRTAVQETERDVYTFLLYDTLQKGSSDDVIVVNISETQMHKNIDGLITSSDNNTFIVDNTGQLVSNSWKSAMLADISGKPYMQTILQAKEAGYFVAEVDGVHSLVTYTLPDYLGWRYVRIVPYATVTSPINSLRLKTVLSALALLAAGLGVSYLISRRLYAKVHNRLVKLVTLEAEKSEHLLKQRQEFLRSVLLGCEKIDLARMQQQLDRLRMPLRADRSCRVVLLKLDRYAQFVADYPSADRLLLKYGIANVAEEVLSAHYYEGAAVEMGENRLALLLNGRDEPTEDGEGPTLEATLRAIQEAVRRYLNLSVSAIVSAPGATALAAAALFNQTTEASLHSLFHGPQCLVSATRVEQGKAKPYEYPIQKEKQLIEELMLGKLDDTKAVLREIIGETADYSYASFHLALSHLSFAIHNAVSTIKRNSDADFDVNVSTLLERMHHLETLEELYAGFDAMFDELAGYLSERKNARHEELVQRIVQLIDSSYMRQDLSLESIADSMQMSSTYIGRLFKKHTLKTILNYIIEVRMRKAHEMLLETAYTVNEIAEKTGFSNTSYFHKAFKKWNGVTPLDFRKNARPDGPQAREIG
ncbi:AraC family transcriptional regulator [Paenibacillus athensensis]|uniref:HTH araC/xylS-type domain-containing protein n=1 Tax=Paenibacillus athensensis TaxID=1967502 RepID=A0A4Y8PQ92_9BACL|nr:AraC family transcriptional regulator [Paenibacillus athensensis]MCD1258335.1 AraC family transcriptional regulator [Paenibacillus athensensis]